jgi:hypothetical protein
MQGPQFTMITVYGEFRRGTTGTRGDLRNQIWGGDCPMPRD